MIVLGRYHVNDRRLLRRVNRAANWLVGIILVVVMTLHMIPEVAGYGSLLKLMFGDL